VLLFIGSVGLLARAHEMVTDLAGLAGVAMALYGLTLADRRPASGGAVAGAGAGIAFLGNGFLPLAMLLMLVGLLPLTAPFWRTRRYAATLLVLVGCAVPFVAAWLLTLEHSGPDALHAWLRHATQTRWNDPASAEGPGELLYFLRILPWYAWPALPLAAWTLWRSRRTLAGRRELLLPVVAFVSFLIVASVFGEPRDVDALPLLLPLA